MMLTNTQPRKLWETVLNSRRNSMLSTFACRITWNHLTLIYIKIPYYLETRKPDFVWQLRPCLLLSLYFLENAGATLALHTSLSFALFTPSLPPVLHLRCNSLIPVHSPFLFPLYFTLTLLKNKEVPNSNSKRIAKWK